MAFGGAGRALVRAFNRVATELITAPMLGQLFGRRLTTISYVGRRSGKVFSLPVAYWREGDQVRIGVAMPEAKAWWRNFLGDGHPLTILLDGAGRTGQAVAQRDEQGRVTVAVQLDAR
ncbi:hypothetical protein BST33_10520 [Mycolicibacter minnesotensis]|uniref:Uncharacterized protein n=1 Tax=Mycolicibacter minnesotensis TaxID=1118379 RepID=A0A7I7R925_9MYCO|nr:hypothetical protein [Mycolicibacter minnesotensis]ORB00759.1 hypothetical protein BST33_10520 [Mycolicibacter minnesotensis]BBY34540.1 hypothetical protein MMIN_26010 [Mycolicibacter minnesotensis]